MDDVADRLRLRNNSASGKILELSGRAFVSAQCVYKPSFLAILEGMAFLLMRMFMVL